jgi:hypothetical protein
MYEEYGFAAVGTPDHPYLILQPTIEGIDEALKLRSPEIQLTLYDKDGCLRRSPDDTELAPAHELTDEELRRFYAHVASVLAAQASAMAEKAALDDVVQRPIAARCRSIFCWL